MAPQQVGYQEGDSRKYYDEFMRRLATHPGVAHVALADSAPFVESRSSKRLRRTGDETDIPALQPYVSHVLSPHYFDAIGLRVLRGRTFTAQEIGAGTKPQPVVVLSESLARRLFGTIEVIGQSVESPSSRGPSARSDVIGVVADAHFFSLIDQPELMLYDLIGISAGRFPPLNALILVRAAAGVDIDREARRIAASLNTSLPVTTVTTMTRAVQQARADQDALGRLLIALAVLACLLSGIGVYGVVAFASVSRRHEFGIRMALGATPERVRRLIIRGTIPMTIAGVAVGLGGAVGLVQALRSRLVGVQPFDPLIWSAAAITLVGIVLVASMIPAWRATRVSVAETLRTM